MVGCEAAEFLAEREHEAAIIEMKDVIGADVVPENRPFLFANFEKHHVALETGAKVSEFLPGRRILRTGRRYEGRAERL